MKLIAFMLMMCAAAPASALTCKNDYAGADGCASNATAAGDCTTLGFSKSNTANCNHYIYCPFDPSYKRCVNDKAAEPSTCPTGYANNVKNCGQSGDLGWTLGTLNSSGCGQCTKTKCIGYFSQTLDPHAVDTGECWEGDTLLYEVNECEDHYRIEPDYKVSCEGAEVLTALARGVITESDLEYAPRTDKAFRETYEDADGTSYDWITAYTFYDYSCMAKGYTYPRYRSDFAAGYTEDSCIDVSSDVCRQYNKTESGDLYLFQWSKKCKVDSYTCGSSDLPCEAATQGCSTIYYEVTDEMLAKATESGDDGCYYYSGTLPNGIRTTKHFSKKNTCTVNGKTYYRYC